MKLIKKSLLVLTAGLMASTLSGCMKGELVIPPVDVNSLQISLPNLPTRNSGSVRSEGGYDYIDLYELSDFHGAVHYEQHSNSDYIGLEKLASYFDSKRAQNEGGTIILSTGDMFQGSADSNLTRGYMVNYAMQYMGFDAMAVGNHEFDWTEEWLKKNAELKYNSSAPGLPFLGANITKGGVMPSYLQKSTIVERGDYKIGVIGVIGNTLEDTVLKTALADFEFSKYASIVQAESARLKDEENCNAVVLLAHEGADHLETLPTGTVQAAFGGHAHDDKQGSVGGATSLATLNYGQSVAHITLKFNNTDHSFVASENAEIVAMKDVSASLQKETGITQIMNQYAPAINEIKNIKLGTANAELLLDKAIKNICTKTMYETAVSFAKDVSEIDEKKIMATYHNVNGGIRSNIAAGDITYGSVYSAFPFDNEVVLIKVNADEFVQKLPKLSELGTYKVFETKSDFVSGEDYYIATTDYVALSSYFTRAGFNLTDEDLIRTGKIVRDEVAKKIYSIDKVKNEVWSKNEKNFRPITSSYF